MSSKTLLSFILMTASLALAGCPEDPITPDQAVGEQGVDGKTPDLRRDQGHKDGLGNDSAAEAAPPDAMLPDLAQPDMAWPAVCDKTCLKASKYDCVKNAKGQCVECTKAEHCTKNPWSLGPKCDTKNSYCVCAADADCAKWPSGHKCVGFDPAKLCGCTGDSDCAAPRKCIGYFSTLKICEMPCKSNKDCPDKKNSPLCDTVSGRCMACLTDKDCATGYRLGDKCLKNSKGFQTCGCAADSHCAKNPHGPTCQLGFKRCTCKADSECTTAPYSLCALPYKGAAFAHCEKPCVNASDCGKDLACMLTSKKCGEPCLSDAHCMDKKLPYCQKATSTCVSCQSDKQCSGSKPHCVPIYGQCKQCVTSAHCTSSSLPHCDQLYYACFECIADAHCKGTGKYTWGNKCTFNMFIGKICRCETNADCKGNAMGPTCYTDFLKCSCAKDSDCTVKPYTNCYLPYPGAKYKRCQKPCKTDNDCDLGSAPRCHAASGACVACLSAGHCNRGTSPICDAKTHGCTGCAAAKDCALSRFGRACETSKCACKADKDCAVDTWGAKCIASSKRCGCAKDTDCAKSVLGQSCDTTNSVCGCSTNSHCPTGKTCTGKSVAGTKICM